MTEITKINSKDAVIRAVDTLNSGGTIIYPTETCYGLGADATNDSAVSNIVKIKKRSKSKRISAAFSDLNMARKYLVITKDAEKLAKAFMPGPLTLIVESKSRTNGRIEDASDGSTKKVGFRIPDNDFARSLIRKLGKPITSTSANISGDKELYRIKDVIKAFDGIVDLIVDAGNLPKRKPSTVYDVAERKILRKGPVSEKEIIQVLS